MDNQLQQSQSMSQIITLMKSKVPYIWVNTFEVEKFLQEFNLRLIEERVSRKKFIWTVENGIFDFQADPVSRIQKATFNGKDRTDVDKKLKYGEVPSRILNYRNESIDPLESGGTLLILLDFHVWLLPPVARGFRDIYHCLQSENKTILFVSPYLGHPSPGGFKYSVEPTLEKEMVVVDYDLNNQSTIKQWLINFVKKMNYDKEEIIQKRGNQISEQQMEKLRKTKFQYSEQELEEMATALAGLTDIEIQNAMNISLQKFKRLDLEYFNKQKNEIIKKSEVLEVIDTNLDINSVGGLDEAKHYFSLYKDQFSREFKEFGVDPLRGVLLAGVPGTGKSLIAKTVASLWKIPLIKLELSRIFSSLVGSSEQRMRESLRIAAVCAPCVLWIDEIEKGLSGLGSSDKTDGGVTSRIFGTLLTAMQEDLHNVVIIATANNVEGLPPELMRRFNDVMFVDLPYSEEREEIFKIHLSKRNKYHDGIDLGQIVKDTHEYTGAEIEKVIKEAIVLAWHDNKSKVTTEHLLKSIKQVRPISVLMSEKIKALREWARTRARFASTIAKEKAIPENQTLKSSSGEEIDFHNIGKSLGSILD